MTDRAWTIGILVGTTVLLVAWDVYVAAFNDEEDDTITAVVSGFARRHTVFPFAVGVIMGHLFW